MFDGNCIRDPLQQCYATCRTIRDKIRAAYEQCRVTNTINECCTVDTSRGTRV